MTKRPTQSSIVRRDDLDAALGDIESGKLTGTSCIIFGRAWWEQLSALERRTFRRRAKKARVTLRSDSKIGAHFVELRSGPRDDIGLSTEQVESPYRE